MKKRLDDDRGAGAAADGDDVSLIHLVMMIQDGVKKEKRLRKEKERKEKNDEEKREPKSGKKNGFESLRSLLLMPETVRICKSDKSAD